jgi:thymidine kinase|tara:strand:- start:2907 stop:3461 length:555 start_codon:yes stop_codon:yes gene_type:complete
MSKSPELIIYTGPMFGGKTTKLLAALERYQYQNKRTALFKPNMDVRYSKDKVVTHRGQHHKSLLARTGEDIIRSAEQADVIAVDEMFMIPGSAKALLKLFSQGKTILVSTLQLSSHPSALEEVSEIMPWATRIQICPAVCSKCDRDAYYTRRLVDGDDTVQVGGQESYEPLCFYHYSEIENIKF